MMRKLIPMFLVALVAAILAVPATSMARPHGITIDAHTASSYCGTPAMNKSQWVGFWKRGGALTKGAERWVRQHASYTHIKPDQGFLSWAKQPQIMSVYTPAGYTLSSNTYCPGGSYLPYNGRLQHSKQKVMAWCNASAKNQVIVTKVRKHGHLYFKYVTVTSLTCVPLVKGYCRNFVTGKPFKVVKRKVKYRRVKTKKVVKKKIVKVPVGQTCESFGGHIINNVCTIQVQGTSGVGNCNSTNSGNNSGTGGAQGSCNNVQVVCNGPGSCSPQTINYCTGASSGGTATTGGVGGNATTDVCNTDTPPCTQNCTPVTTCPDGSVPPPGGGCKDGTQTPPPPVIVPGPNPPPNGGPTDPGSHQCYNETDNMPVSPVWNTGTLTWDCPIGSYGA